MSDFPRYRARPQRQHPCFLEHQAFPGHHSSRTMCQVQGTQNLSAFLALKAGMMLLVEHQLWSQKT